MLRGTNLKQSEIRDELSAHGGIVTDSAKSLFSANAKINKWSWYKPVECPTVKFNITDSNLASVNDGFTVSSYQGLQILLQAMQATAQIGWDSSFWDYTLPTTYFRLGDFRYYDADQQNWFNLATEDGFKTTMVEQGGSLVLKGKVDYASFVHTMSVFGTNSQLCLFITKSNVGDSNFSYGDGYIIKLCALELTSNDMTFHLTFPADIALGEWHGCLIAISGNAAVNSLNNGGFLAVSHQDTVSGTFVPLPVGMVTVTVRSSQDLSPEQIEALDRQRKALVGDVTITNNSVTLQTVRKVITQLSYKFTFTRGENIGTIEEGIIVSYSAFIIDASGAARFLSQGSLSLTNAVEAYFSYDSSKDDNWSNISYGDASYDEDGRAIAIYLRYSVNGSSVVKRTFGAVIS